MGVYYQYVNYTKKEVVCLSAITNIKSGAFSSWSLQTAIFNVFMGFGYPRAGVDFGPWLGRWKRDSVCIENDNDCNDSDDWPGEEYDAGEEFLRAMPLEALRRWFTSMELVDTYAWGQICKLYTPIETTAERERVLKLLEDKRQEETLPGGKFGDGDYL